MTTTEFSTEQEGKGRTTNRAAKKGYRVAADADMRSPCVVIEGELPSQTVCF
jgi:hypothetical protein